MIQDIIQFKKVFLSFVTGILSLMIFPHISDAQVVQRGYTKEYNGRAEKTPLPNVELRINNAGSTMSGEKGEFSLQFRTLKPGAKVIVEEIYKEGYELLNPDMVRQWYISDDDQPYTLVMCQSKRIKELKDKYAKASSESYARQQKKEEDMLAKERDAGKLKDSEYQEKIQNLKNEYAQKLDDIHSYFEKFARIDLNSLSEREANIMNLIQEGEIDRAILQYDEMELDKKLSDCSRKIKKSTAALDALQTQKAKDLAERDSLYEIFLRSIEVLQLAGGADNYDKIGQKLKQIADEDSTYMKAVTCYAEFLMEQKQYDDCEKYARIAERGLKGEPNDTLISVFRWLGNINYQKFNPEEAISYYKKAYQMVENINMDSLALFSLKAACLTDLIHVYELNGSKTEEVLNDYLELLEISRELQMRDSVEYAYIHDMTILNFSKFLSDVGQFKIADSIAIENIKQLNEKYESDSINYEKLLAIAEINYANSLMRQKKFEKVESLLVKWIVPMEKYAEDNPSSSGDILLLPKYSLMNYYGETGNKNKFIEAVNSIQDDCLRLMKNNPSYYKYFLIELQLNTGHYLTEIKDYNLANIYLKKASCNIIEDKEKNTERYKNLAISADTNLGVVYACMDSLELAERHWLSAINHSKRMHFTNDTAFPYSVVNAYGNLGSLYYKQEKYILAEEYFNKFLIFAEKIPDSIREFGNLLFYAIESMEEIYLRKGETEKALFCVNKLISYSEIEGDTNKLAMYHLSAAQLQLNLKKKKKAREEWKAAEAADMQYANSHGSELRKMLFGK